MSAENQPKIHNRRAKFEYHFLEELDAGIVLSGPEVKSVREGKVNLEDAFCFFRNGVLVMRDMNISPYKQGSFNNLPSKRERLLLLNKHELMRLGQKIKERGLTIIPIMLFFNERNICKVRIALAKGKKLYDKRATIKERDAQREMRRMQ